MTAFQRLMQKYKFITPVPIRVQKKVISSTNKNIKKILKRFGNYSILFSLVLFIKKLALKIGISITVFQSKIITAIAVASVVTASGVSGYYVVNELISAIEETEEVKKDSDIEDVSAISRNIIEKDTKSRSVSAALPVIGFQYLKSADTDSDTAKGITKKIIENIRFKIKDRIIKILPLSKRGQAAGFITGSVRSVEGTTYITVKLIDVKSSSVILIADEKLEKDADIDSACRRLADKLIKRIK